MIYAGIPWEIIGIKPNNRLHIPLNIAINDCDDIQNGLREQNKWTGNNLNDWLSIEDIGRIVLE